MKHYIGDSIINIAEIEGIYKDYCEDNEITFSEKTFEKFVGFLEENFYDWLRENLRQFNFF